MKLHDEPKNWEKAKKACEDEKGELIKPDKARINNWIRDKTNDEVYIGANDLVGTGWMRPFQGTR